MDKRFAVTALAVVLVMAGAVGIATRPDPSPEATTLNETVSGIERDPEQTPPVESSSPDYMYIIREHQGRVAVFSADNPDTPEITYDTLVKYLPDYDRSQLEQGVPVADYKTLVSLIEDYIS